MLSHSLKEPFSSREHQVWTVDEQGASGWNDTDLWEMVDNENMFFVTTDKEFGDIRKYPPGSHNGILLLRPATDSLVAYKEIIVNLLQQYDLDRFSNKITVASKGRIRIRTKKDPASD